MKAKQAPKRFSPPEGTISVLLLNPNSSRPMTEAMARLVIPKLKHATMSIILETYTAPSGPKSINNDQDIKASTDVVLEDERLMRLLHGPDAKYDYVIVACFSVHPLVSVLGGMLSIPVIGIFEASVDLASGIWSRTARAMFSEDADCPTTTTSAGHLEEGMNSPQQQGDQPQGPERWAIITTGEFWEEHLSTGVERLGKDDDSFVGVFSTGLTAADFHTGEEIDQERIKKDEEIKRKVREAMRRLLQCQGVRYVIMGCGGMGSLRTFISDTAVELTSSKIQVIDPVVAAMSQVHDFEARGEKSYPQ
ncbi:Uncharacterized protein ESCO_003423 [Escovopsis weberi]|uniref:Hydantoin racemase n=1 Tax=Escovopsis weberi TaxID=150374 RepID=A0A0M8N9S8_ESCWE|nr:Uncharacterized protein ESCO_003423 [Escovopsis weberi]